MQFRRPRVLASSQELPGKRRPSRSRAAELSLREALQLGHDYIGTEHILLGLIREGDGVAAQVLVHLGADLNTVRQQVIQIIGGQRLQDESTWSVLVPDIAVNAG